MGGPPGRRAVTQVAAAARRAVAVHERRRRLERLGRDGRRRRERVGQRQSLLELEQLAHEVQVRRDDGTALLHQSVRLDEAQLRVAHQVSDGNRRRPRDARVTVHEHGAAVRSGLLYKQKKQFEISTLFLELTIHQHAINKPRSNVHFFLNSLSRTFPDSQLARARSHAILPTRTWQARRVFSLCHVFLKHAPFSRDSLGALSCRAVFALREKKQNKQGPLSRAAISASQAKRLAAVTHAALPDALLSLI